MNEAMNPKTVHKPLGMYSHTISVPPNAAWLVISGQVGMNAKVRLRPVPRNRPSARLEGKLIRWRLTVDCNIVVLDNETGEVRVDGMSVPAPWNEAA